MLGPDNVMEGVTIGQFTDPEGHLIGLLEAVDRNSAAASLYSFWPRDYPVTDVRTLRDDYIYAQEEFTKLRLLDSQIGMIEQIRAQLLRKAKRLKFATAGLAVSVLLAAVGFAVRFLS